MSISLNRYTVGSFNRGRSAIVEASWYILQIFFVSSRLPGSSHRKFLLRLFGATIGAGTTFKPGIRIKFPWRLTIGNHSWIGEDVWIDNLASVTIGDHVCISQGTYLCTGSHDWSKERFDLLTQTIKVDDGAWLAARTNIGPGVVVHKGAVLTLGSSAYSDLAAWTIYTGVPAQPVRHRRLIDDTNKQTLDANGPR